MKGKIIISVISAALVVGGILAAVFFLRTEYCFTRIDNSRYTQKTDKGTILYEYALVSYDDEGNEKDVVFNTTRELRSGAFLKLKYTRLGGVVDWEEVKWAELPESLKNVYNNPD